MPALNSPSPHDPQGRLIFAVDDDAGDLLLIVRLLEQPGLSFPCRLFSSGEKLIDALLHVMRGAPAPLLCFVDVKMAGLSGFDVLRWIRCQDALDCVPVVMLSSSDDPENPLEGCGVGAQCYVKKFPSAAELKSLVTQARNYSAERVMPAAFHAPCNLLPNSPNALPRMAVA